VILQKTVHKKGEKKCTRKNSPQDVRGLWGGGSVRNEGRKKCTKEGKEKEKSGTKSIAYNLTNLPSRNERTGQRPQRQGPRETERGK